MLVLTFNAQGAGNAVDVDDVPYMYAHTSAGSGVVEARCAHRGGPLHLASLDDTGTRLVCPWHDKTTSIDRLVRRGVPGVRRGNEVTAVFAVADDTPYKISHLPLSPDLCTGCTRHDGDSTGDAPPSPTDA